MLFCTTEPGSCSCHIHTPEFSGPVFCQLFPYPCCSSQNCSDNFLPFWPFLTFLIISPFNAWPLFPASLVMHFQNNKFLPYSKFTKKPYGNVKSSMWTLGGMKWFCSVQSLKEKIKPCRTIDGGWAFILFWGDFGAFWGNFGNFGSHFWGDFGDILGGISSHFGVILGGFYGHFRGSVGGN